MSNVRTLVFAAAALLLIGVGALVVSTVTKDGDKPVAAIGPGPSGSTKGSAARSSEVDLAGSRLAPEPASATTGPRGTAPDPVVASDERESAESAFVVTGLVTDEESGAPVKDATLVAVGGATPLPVATTDEDGRFRLAVRDVASTHVVVQPPEGFNVREPTHMLPPIVPGGSATLDFKLILWPPPIAGDIRGVLQSEGGAWSADELPSPGAVLLDLVSTRPPRIQRRSVPRAEEDGAGGHWLSFAFENVPRGEYELTLSSLDNYRWHPQSVFVSPPADGLAFLRYDLDATLPLTFHVYERTTGEPIEDYEVRHIKLTVSDDNGVLLHTGPLDPDAFPLDAEFTWSVWAPGLAPVFGNERSFELDEGQRVAEVRLSEGWGGRFLVMGGRGTKYPLSGATILLDGEVIGSSRDDGTLDTFREEPPKKIEVRYLDWKLKRDPLKPFNGLTQEGRGMVIPVELEPPG